MASDSLIGDGLAPSPYREAMDKVKELEAELADFRIKFAMTQNLFFGPHKGHYYNEDYLNGL